MDKATLKKRIIARIGNLSDPENPENDTCSVLTPAGLIFGYTDANTPERRIVEKLAMDEAKAYRDEHGISDDELLDGNDGFLVLYDAQIITSFKKIKLPFAIVFYDQVVGITYGVYSEHSVEAETPDPS